MSQSIISIHIKRDLGYISSHVNMQIKNIIWDITVELIGLIFIEQNIRFPQLSCSILIHMEPVDAIA